MGALSPRRRDGRWLRAAALSAALCGADDGAALAASAGAAALARAEVGDVAIAADPFFIHEALLEGQKASFVGGLVLTAADQRFGGFSGMLLRGERLLAVSDRGGWLAARLVSDGAGAPTGLDEAQMGALRGASGARLSGWRGDAESLTPDGRGGVWVGLENPHAIARHAHLAEPAQSGALRPPAAGVAANQGVEALARLPDGALLALSEAPADDGAAIQGWRLDGDDARPVSIERVDGFTATGADVGPDGALYLLERRADWAAGLKMRIRRFDAAALAGIEAVGGAAGPHRLGRGETLLELDLRAFIDNMEALSVERRDDGKLILTTLSDDNFRSLQRTLLLRFLVDPAR